MQITNTVPNCCGLAEPLILRQRWIFTIHVLCGYYSDVIMGAMASQITSLTIVYSPVYSGGNQTKHQSSALPAFVRGIHRWPVNSQHKWPVTGKMFPFDDVILDYKLSISTMSALISLTVPDIRGTRVQFAVGRWQLVQNSSPIIWKLG